MSFIIEWVEQAEGEPSTFSFTTPFGPLLVVQQGNTITGTDWSLQQTQYNSVQNHPLATLLAAYWTDPQVVIHLQLLRQGTPFRNRVWQALQAIPGGTTRSYSSLAAQLQSSARAVGNACRDNPYALFIPCHRVVALHGPGGYCGKTSGEFMMIKQQLLQFEAG